MSLSFSAVQKLKKSEIRPCRIFVEHYNDEDFRCAFYDREWVQFVDVPELKDLCINCVNCPNYENCREKYKTVEKGRRYESVNTVLNFYGKDRIDIVRYNTPFKVVSEVVGDLDIDTSRNFKYVGDVLVPLKDTATISKLEKTIAKGSKRAQDNYFGYALTNSWTYFFTFTFSPSLCNRIDDNEVKGLWSTFRQHIQRNVDKNVKILCVPERHKDNSLHFHALISFTNDLPIVDYGDVSKLPQRECTAGRNKGQKGFCTYDTQGNFTCLPDTQHKVYLVPYYEYGKLQFSSSGEMLFCLNIFSWGRNSCALLPKDNDIQQLKVVNYLITYTTKECNLGYEQKRYYRTHNLNFKNKVVTDLSDEDFAQILKSNNMQVWKSGNTTMGNSNSTFTVYRNFNLEKTPALTSKKSRLSR